MGRATKAPSERLAGIAAVIVGLLLAAPIVVVRYPPMGDLAMHEALVAILRHRGDPSWFPPGLYGVVAPQANQLFQFAALALSFVFSTAVACKLVVALIVAVTPPLGARVLAQLGRSRWLALLLGPIVCGWMFRWGLVANMAGLAALLFALPLLERFVRRPSARGAVVVSASACLVFFAHESSALLFAVFAGVFALVRGKTGKGTLVRLAPALVVAVLAVVQWRVSEGLLSANMRAIGTDYGADPLERLAILPGAIFGGLSAPSLLILGGAWIAALVPSVLARRTVGTLPLRAALWHHRYALLALVFFLFYLVVPMSIGGTTLLAHRFLPGACLCLLVACAPLRTPRLSIGFAVIALLELLAGEAHVFREADARYRALDAMISLVPRDVAVAQLDLTPRPAGHIAPVPGAAGRVLAERGGRMLFAFTDTPPNPITMPPDLRWSEAIARLVLTPYAFMPTYDLTRFSYLLERNENPQARMKIAHAIAPEAELVAAAGEWTLFRSRLPVGPLTAPDRPLPVPPPETLADRLRQP